jgi:glutathione synthase/RimK-type ligase-like ATP-grasp enzyme
MKNALIVKCLTSKDNFTNRHLIKSFQKRGFDTQLFEITETTLTEENVMMCGNETLKHPNIIIFSHPIFTPRNAIKPHMRQNLEFLKSLGAVCINEIQEHINVADKEFTTKRLQEANIKMVKSEIIRVQDFLYNKNNETVSLPEDLNDAVDRLGGYPIVFKNIVGMLGLEVFVANNYEELSILIRTKLKHPRFILQEYQKSAEALMIDARVIDQNVFTRILLSSPYGSEESKSTIRTRSSMIPCYVSDSIRDLVLSANRVLGLDVTRTEMFIGGDGVKLCEVNSIGAIVGNEQANNVDVCDLIVDLAIKKLEVK